MSVIVIPYVNAKYETMVITLISTRARHGFREKKTGSHESNYLIGSNGVIWRTWACTERTRRATTVHNAPRASSLAGSDERRVL